MLIAHVLCYHVTMHVMLSCTVIGTMMVPGCYETVCLRYLSVLHQCLQAVSCLFSMDIIVPVVLPGLLQIPVQDTC